MCVLTSSGPSKLLEPMNVAHMANVVSVATDVKISLHSRETKPFFWAGACRTGQRNSSKGMWRDARIVAQKMIWLALARSSCARCSPCGLRSLGKVSGFAGIRPAGAKRSRTIETHWLAQAARRLDVMLPSACVEIRCGTSLFWLQERRRLTRCHHLGSAGFSCGLTARERTSLVLLTAAVSNFRAFGRTMKN